MKKENKLLLMLAFFSISVGLWGNFRQLWLQDNNFDVSQISNIISIGTFISVIGIILVGKFIKFSKLKTFFNIALIGKVLCLIVLYFLNGITNQVLINIFIVLDIVLEYIIFTSIYPLITNIIKTDTVYSKRQLTEYLFKDVGILIGGMIIGRSIAGMVVNYNICLMISIIFLLISIAVIFTFKQNKEKEEVKVRSSIIKYVLKNKLLVIYLIYMFLGSAAMSTALGLKMLTLTNFYNFSDGIATNYLLIIGLIADLVGILALKYFTPKNDYITMTIKFGIRYLGYVIAFFSNDLFIMLIAMTWSILISTAYENICDGPYVNLVENKYQLQFTNLRYIVRFLGEAIGIYLCGLMYVLGLKYMLGLSAILIVPQLILAYSLIYIRNNKTRENKEIS